MSWAQNKNDMKLLPGENKLITSDNDSMNLTNYRITKRDEIWGKSYKISIFLEDISSIEVHFKSHIVLLIIGVLMLLAGLGMSIEAGPIVSVGSIVVGGIFIAIWWFSRKHIVSISSDGGSTLNILAKGMSDSKIDDFITSVQEAKLKRMSQLYKL
jgi:hypothetical protein